MYEYVEDEGADGTEEKGGYNGKKLVINSQVRVGLPILLSAIALTHRNARTAFIVNYVT